MIEVQDIDIGIESEVIDKIFEPLYTAKATGICLDLSICKQIIEHHQGQISFKSYPGEGTTITIALPELE
jgi:signal transduction histidine kinase